MKPSTKDQLEGTLHEVKGIVKETVGEVMKNPNLVTEGENEKLAGVVHSQIEKVFEQ